LNFVKYRHSAKYDCHDSFPRRKFENRAAIGCRQGSILLLPTISFELHAKMAEEIDLEMCSYGQLSEVQMLYDLDLDLGSVQGHAYTVRVGLPACPTVPKYGHLNVVKYRAGSSYFDMSRYLEPTRSWSQTGSKPNSIMLSGSKLVADRFEAGRGPASSC